MITWIAIILFGTLTIMNIRRTHGNSHVIKALQLSFIKLKEEVGEEDSVKKGTKAS
jgi:hypothetical protein